MQTPKQLASLSSNVESKGNKTLQWWPRSSQPLDEENITPTSGSRSSDNGVQSLHEKQNYCESDI